MEIKWRMNTDKKGDETDGKNQQMNSVFKFSQSQVIFRRCPLLINTSAQPLSLLSWATGVTRSRCYPMKHTLPVPNGYFLPLIVFISSPPPHTHPFLYAWKQACLGSSLILKINHYPQLAGPLTGRVASKKEKEKKTNQGETGSVSVGALCMAVWWA